MDNITNINDMHHIEDVIVTIISHLSIDREYENTKTVYIEK